MSSGNIWGDITPECNPPRNKNLPCPNGHTKIMSNMCRYPQNPNPHDSQVEKRWPESSYFLLSGKRS